MCNGKDCSRKYVSPDLNYIEISTAIINHNFVCLSEIIKEEDYVNRLRRRLSFSIFTSHYRGRKNSEYERKMQDEKNNGIYTQRF